MQCEVFRCCRWTDDVIGGERGSVLMFPVQNAAHLAGVVSFILHFLNLSVLECATEDICCLLGLVLIFDPSLCSTVWSFPAEYEPCTDRDKKTYCTEKMQRRRSAVTPCGEITLEMWRETFYFNSGWVRTFVLQPKGGTSTRKLWLFKRNYR